MLAHKNVFNIATVKCYLNVSRLFKGDETHKSNGGSDKRVCFFCLDPRILIAYCKARKQKSGAS